MELSEDIVNTIISFIFTDCDYCFETIHFKELIKDCIIYKEKKHFVTYDKVCIYCLHKISYKFKIIHL